MILLIDGIPFSDYGITVLDYTPMLGIANERENERDWADKSGVDKNLVNVRYDTLEIILPCLVKADTAIEAYKNVRELTDYMFSHGCFVVSLQDQDEARLCERSKVITPTINIREQNSLYYFKLYLTDVNPNAIKYYPTASGSSVSIDYSKGKNAVIYWGDGQIGEVSNSNTYTNDAYALDGKTAVIIDTDKSDSDVTTLDAEFEADLLTVYRNEEIQFTDLSTGGVSIWSWAFGDDDTSDEQNPTHSYDEVGLKTVTLQIFNTVQGSSTEIKTSYIEVLNTPVTINDTEAISVNDTDVMTID